MSNNVPSGKRVRDVGAAVLLVLCLTPAVALAQGMLGTKHNLSVTGPGPIKALTETQVCVFCHTPHNAEPSQPPLWNRAFSSATYTPYDSPSIQFTPGQPTGYSKLCLSCHDGTIAIGQVRNLWGQSATIQMTGASPEGQMPSGPTLLGTNLTNDHPISFAFTSSLAAADGELWDPSTLTGPIRLYPGTTAGIRDNVQCTTCHDPHTVVNPKFLKKSPMGQADNLCLTCHNKPSWIGSSHETDAFFWPANQTATRVRDWSCFGCHTPHTVQGAERLLRDAAVGGQSAIEETCYRCHQPAASGGIVLDVKTEFQKTWRHPVTLNPGAHKPVFVSSTPLPENVLLSPGQPAPDPRFTDAKHVECVDCHNPHKVKKTNRTEGMRGILLDGSIISNVINDPIPADGQSSQVQYPICLRCHGDTYNTVIGTGTLPSGATPSNKKTEFQTTNSAFHPLGGPGRNTSSNLNDQLSPNGLGTRSVIKCTDCHNSNAYENTAGRAPSTGTAPTTPVGPHGSIYPSIRRARYENTLPGPASWNPANFNLCFRCHDVTRLTAEKTGGGARTNFYDDINGKGNLHWVHLIDRISKSRPLCKSCHYNVHSNQEQTNTQYSINGVVSCNLSSGIPCPPPPATPTRLINFHPNIRPISGRARPEWRLNTATKQRQCFLQCHNPDGSPGGAVMGGAAGEAGGKKAEYRPNTGDLP